MGSTLFAQRKILLTQLKSDLAMRMMIMSNRMTRISAQNTDLEQRKAKYQTEQITGLINEETGTVNYDKIKEAISSSTEIDAEIKLNNIKLEDMEIQVQSMNSEMEQLKAEYDEIEKAETQSIKNTYGAFSNK